MMTCQLVVRTLVRRSLHAAVSNAVTAAFEELEISSPRVGNEVPGAPALVEHAASPTELYARFPYSACAILVADWVRFCECAEQVPNGITPESLLAGWDGALLIVPEPLPVELRTLLHGRLAPRLSVALLADVYHSRFRPDIGRLAAVAAALPSDRAALSAIERAGIEALPVRWRVVLLHALRMRNEWSVKRLHAACGVDRRTLERGFAKAALPSPAELLRPRPMP